MNPAGMEQFTNYEYSIWLIKTRLLSVSSPLCKRPETDQLAFPLHWLQMLSGQTEDSGKGTDIRVLFFSFSLGLLVCWYIYVDCMYFREYCLVHRNVHRKEFLIILCTYFWRITDIISEEFIFRSTIILSHLPDGEGPPRKYARARAAFSNLRAFELLRGPMTPRSVLGASEIQNLEGVRKAVWALSTLGGSKDSMVRKKATVEQETA